MTAEAPESGNLNKHLSANPLQRFFIGRFLNTLRQALSGISYASLCEIGCGEGFVLKDLSDHGLLSGRRVTGMDPRQEALDFAGSFVPQVDFRRGSIYALPFKNKEWDCVLALEVLEHLDDPAKALQELSRVANYLVLSVPHEPFFQTANFLRGKNWKLWGNDPEHIHHWGMKGFRKLIQPYGEILKLEAPFPWLMAVLKAG